MDAAPPEAAHEVLGVVRRLLETERAGDFSDTAAPEGLSAWVRERLETLDGDAADTLRRLLSYSQLRVATRRRLVENVLSQLPRAPAGTPRAVAQPGKQAATPSPPGGQRPSLADSVDTLWGVGATAARRLASLGIRTIGDLLRHAPQRYIDRSSVVPIRDVVEGTEVTVIGRVIDVSVRPARNRRLQIIEATIADDTGQIGAVWFNQPYLARNLRGRHNVALAGRVEIGPWGRQLSNPEHEFDAARMIHAGRLVPIYPLPSGLTQRQVRRWVDAALDDYGRLVRDPLPDRLVRRLELPALPDAVRAVHFPDSREAATTAARRLAFDELLVYQLAILRHRRHWRESNPGRPVRFDRDALSEFGDGLRFKLTNDQRRALADILNDLRRPQPMSRLLQGDVGCGKTVVAAGALFAVARAGWQSAIMAPTEVLAEQHLDTLSDLLGSRGLRVELVIGRVPAAQKRTIWRAVESGDVDVVIGTQALIQQTARFAKLNLAVVDEQHRFGVQQRGEIRAKGYNPHLLAMTATPIPRTLALTIYGDLDVSSIKEMPKGRRKITTRWVPSDKRDDAYAFVRQQVEDGRQAFVITPIISESETLQVRSATVEHERLRRNVYPDLADAIGLLHGRLSGKAKDAAMRRFRDGADKILVSTAVVEVGIDVPNATVMMIEGAERFGLAQLHQLRGRVGRGAHASYCLLLSDTTDATENARLRVLQSMESGFDLAQRDLELRGPGEILGNRQHGLLDFHFASITDLETIMRARAEAEALVGDDPELALPEHRGLAGAVGEVLARIEWN